MSYAKGVVEQISIKDPKDGQYGKWANYGIKMNVAGEEKWYNGAVNADKNTGQLIVKDKSYNEVKPGMEIEFMTEEKNGYENIDKKTLKILSSGSNNQQPQSTVQPQQRNSPPQEIKVNTDESLRAACIKPAIDMWQYFAPEDKKKEATLDKITRTAEQFFNYCKTGK